MEAALRWSPHSAGDKGKFLLANASDPSITLNQLDSLEQSSVSYHAIAQSGKLPSFGAFDQSKTDESKVALGLSTGNATVVKLRSDAKGPQEPETTFRIKQQRKCNSISFNSEDWLAVALDRTRSDVSLNIYDAKTENQEPIRKLCAAELVSSVRYLPSQPQQLVASVQRSHIRLYDLRDGHASSGASVQVATRNVNNIAIDPLDENYFASAGSTDDPSVTVWDRRWIGRASQYLYPSLDGGSNGEVFHFRPAVDNAVKTTIWSLRFSGLQRGRLAICSSTGQLKVVDMARGSPAGAAISEYRPHNPYGGSAWASNRYVSKTQSIEIPADRPKDSRIVAFDWIPQFSDSRSQPLLALRKNEEISSVWLGTDNPKAEITAKQGLCIVSKDVTITEPHTRSGHRPSTISETHPLYQGLRGNSDAAAHLEDEDEPLKLRPGSAPLAQALSKSTIQHRRCLKGYLLDCQKNEEIVAGDWMLERLWEIVNRFRIQAQDDSMVCSTLDLSFVGVAGIWLEKPGKSPNRHVGGTKTSMYDAVVGLNAAQELPPFEGERTEYPEHRQLCLAACGWKFTPETLEAECQELIDRGLHYQAIVQAVLHERKHIALNLLRSLIRSKTIPNIGLGALLAADHLNDEQREMCQWMQADTHDTPLKALLTFLSSGNWRDVMKTNYLHLGYRVALGLKYLNDTELSGFIQSETARAVKNGDLEGILLTGLEEQSMDLFQTYITKTNDLQTAVLATAFTNPLYVQDIRWQMWKETYFEQMQHWRAFTQRVRFTTQHARMARSRDGKSLQAPPQKQVQLRCQHCHASLARDRSPQRTRIGPSSFQASSTPNRPATETSCPQCHRPMPRCGICLLWLGTPYPKESQTSPRGSETAETGDDDDAPTPWKVGGGSLESFATFCMVCKHGFHAEHAQLWFAKHRVCPIPDCSCKCGVGYTGQA